MTNKVLISLYIPTLDRTYDVFIPVNEIMWKINKLLVKSVSDLTDGIFPTDKEYILINTESGQVYANNDIVINTNIRNASKLTLISI